MFISTQPKFGKIYYPVFLFNYFLLFDYFELQLPKTLWFPHLAPRCPALAFSLRVYFRKDYESQRAERHPRTQEEELGAVQPGIFGQTSWAEFYTTSLPRITSSSFKFRAVSIFWHREWLERRGDPGFRAFISPLCLCASVFCEPAPGVGLEVAKVGS